MYATSGGTPGPTAGRRQRRGHGRPPAPVASAFAFSTRQAADARVADVASRASALLSEAVDIREAPPVALPPEVLSKRCSLSRTKPPDLDYAQSYPTLGPSGASSDDVTGRACSVEFYFGQDCLLGPDGKLVPVRWKSHIDPMNDYQGEVANKPYVQERIKEMLREAEEGEKPLGSEWDPMRSLAETLISLAEPEPQ